MAVSAGPWMEKDLEMNRGAAKGRKRGKLFLLPALDIAKCHQPRSYGIDKILHECFAKRRQIVFMWPPDPLSGSREGGFFRSNSYTGIVIALKRGPQTTRWPTVRMRRYHLHHCSGREWIMLAAEALRIRYEQPLVDPQLMQR